MDPEAGRAAKAGTVAGAAATVVDAADQVADQRSLIHYHTWKVYTPIFPHFVTFQTKLILKPTLSLFCRFLSVKFFVYFLNLKKKIFFEGSKY